jgi:AmmeMemoRadiSam system protein B
MSGEKAQSGEAIEGESSPIPPLRRDLDVFPVEIEGRSLMALRDSEEEGAKALALSPGALSIAAAFDGRHGAADLRSAIDAPDGGFPSAAEIVGLARRLARAGLLETPEVRALRRKRLEDFKASPVRKALLKGSGYPSDPLELAKLLGGFFRAASGPGKPASEKPAGPPPLGVACPHVDLQRGGPAYAWAYQALSETEPPDLVVAVGVAHAGPNSPWVMTRKAYETPYGPMAADLEAYAALRECLWYDPADDEWAHRTEHSLEFQALWLKFLWREKAPPWVPVLCSPFERFCPEKAPSSVATVDRALGGMGRALAAIGGKKRVLVLAAVDLSHVGRRFGDEADPDAAGLKAVEEADRRALEPALRLDCDAFYEGVVRGGNPRRVCGLSALYTSLRWMRDLGAENGVLLAYALAPDPAAGAVSFASCLFPR